MSPHDDMNLYGYMEDIRRKMHSLQKAQLLKGQSPSSTKPREDVIMEFLLSRIKLSNRNSDLDNVQSAFLPPDYHPSVAALSDLKKVLIKDLLLETHHRGSYILLRAVTPTTGMIGIIAVVEDEKGDVLLLQLYNHETALATDGRLVEGTVVLVKEPFMLRTSSGDLGVRIDHLSDIKFLSDHDPLVPPSWRRLEDDASAPSWKTKGNGYFEQAKYHLAIDCYSKALESTPTAEEALAIRLNRALTCLKTHQFDAALRDLDFILSIHSSSEKALLRKSQALYHLGKFQDSCEVHKVLSKEYPDNDIAKSEFDRTKARLKEQQTGKYPFSQMLLAEKKRRPPLLDHATFVGPVAVRPTESHGRGLFTTEAVRAGDLLLCEKALGYVFFDITTESKNYSYLINAATQEMMVGTHAELAGLIAQKLHKNPSLMPAVTDLYHGSYLPVSVSEVDGAPVVDSFLIERIVRLNAFGCPPSMRTIHLRLIGEAETPQLDINPRFHSCGVWTRASYIIHSCYNNTRCAWIGDMMIVRASRDLPANTEVTMRYKPALDDDIDTRPDMRSWGFACSCAICQNYPEAESSALRKRKHLAVSLTKALQTLFYGPSRTRGEAVAKAEGALSALEKTNRRPCSEVPRLLIWKAYATLAHFYAEGKYYRPWKAVESVLKTLESLGYVIAGGRSPHTPGTTLLVKRWGLMMDGLVACWMILCRMYREVAPDLVDRAEEYARMTYKVCVGEDETFADTYSRDAERVDGLIAGMKSTPFGL